MVIAIEMQSFFFLNFGVPHSATFIFNFSLM